ncbi:MAG: dihydrofolate reductase [Rhizomicrobium sp.]
MISLVVAVAQNGVIGNTGKIPWRIAEDMRHFKAVTLGKPCIMGRKTWDSLPKKPLPGRTNIVVTRDASFEVPGAMTVHSLDEAFACAEAEQAPEIAVIGGADIYAAALSRATRIYLTEVHRAFAGDTHFPAIDRALWRETAREDHATEDGLRYSFVTLERRSTHER